MILNLNPEELSRNRVSVSVNYNAMVYITSWDEFVERSVQLFRADPDSCLKYKTDQAQEAKKMEKLNNIFFTLMARGPEVDPSEVTGKEPMDTQTTKRGRGRKQ
ncbi:hypothetical protein GLYMA_02G141101v4 [Glycine max]|nr:hypothetical protein GLYMA_02G141101v4 [Glycine max]